MKKSPLKRSTFKTKKTPARTLRNKADALWKEAIRHRAGGKCEVCGKSGGVLQAHHIFTREIYHLRHQLENGILLCFTHHTGSPQESAHQNPDNFREWLCEKRGKDWYDSLRKWSMEHRKPNYEGEIAFLKEYRGR